MKKLATFNLFKMKIDKIIFIAFIIQILSGCSSVQELERNNSIRVGMTKSEVAKIVLYHGNLEDDAWLNDCYYEYLPETKCEILSGSSRNSYFVFCGASSQSSCSNREGTSILRGIFRSYSDAKVSVTVKPPPPASSLSPATPSPVKTDPKEESNHRLVDRCLGRGLKPGTPEFTKCIIDG